VAVAAVVAIVVIAAEIAATEAIAGKLSTFKFLALLS